MTTPEDKAEAEGILREREAWAKERMELLDRIAELEGQLRQEVAALATGQIEDVKAQAAKTLLEVQLIHEQRLAQKEIP